MCRQPLRRGGIGVGQPGEGAQIVDLIHVQFDPRIAHDMHQRPATLRLIQMQRKTARPEMRRKQCRRLTQQRIGARAVARRDDNNRRRILRVTE